MEAGLSRKQVADALRATTGKLHYIETAVVPPRVRDLEEILFDLYNVPEDRREHYLQAARDAKKKGWWEQFTDITAWFSLYVGLEQGATDIHSWHVQLVPGILQSPGYVTALLRESTEEHSEKEANRLVELRLSRQQILDAPDAPRLWMIIDEAALRSNIGGPSVMREQCAHLLKLSERPRVVIQILPLGVGNHAGMLGGFTIMRFAAAIDPGLVYLEYRTGAMYLEDVDDVRDHQRAFDYLKVAALKPDQSRQMLSALIEEFNE